MPLPYGQIPDAQIKDNTYSFRLGHVERVFTSTEDRIIRDTQPQSQMIKLKPIGYIRTKRKPILEAIPLLRGISDSITRGDLVMYTFIGDTYFYLGPVNTMNNPSKSPDMLYSTSYVVNSNFNKVTLNQKFDRDLEDGYNRNIPRVKVPKLSKLRNDFIDFPYQNINSDNTPRSKEYYESMFTDLIFEGRYGNGLRLGARNEFPQLTISNNNYQNMESLFNGSIISMISLGSIQENFFMDQGFELASDLKIKEGYANQTSEYKGSLLDFDYSFGEIGEAPQERDSVDQIIINSDRIVFNSKVEDITLSSNRGMKFGAGGNIEMTNKGYSVFESRNIYIGKKAKDRSQPMVLGEELRRLLVRILRMLADAQALGDYNVPQALTVLPNVMVAGSLRTEVESIMSDFGLGTLPPPGNNIIESPDPGYLPNVEEGEPVGDRATGNASFFSQHHFIETNRE